MSNFFWTAFTHSFVRFCKTLKFRFKRFTKINKHDPEQNSGVNDVGSLNNVVDVEDVGAWKPLILSDWTTENWLLIEMTLKWIQYIFIFSIWKSWFSYNSDRERWRWLGSYWKIGRLGKMFANKILSIKLAIISIVGECRITWNFSQNYHF